MIGCYGILFWGKTMTSKYLSFMNNEYISAVLTIIVVLYGGLAAPKLPAKVVQLFNNKLFKVLVLALIAFVGRKSPSVSIVAALSIMVVMESVDRYGSRFNLFDAPEGMESVSEVPVGNINNVSFAEFPVVNDSVDYRNDFYPQTVEYQNGQVERNESEEIVGMSSDDSYASVE